MAFEGYTYQSRSINTASVNGDSNSNGNLNGIYYISGNVSTTRTEPDKTNEASDRNHVMAAENNPSGQMQADSSVQPYSGNLNEWQRTALILDRLFFVILCLATIGIFLSVMIMFLMQDYS